jgi:hypothetical protein
MLTYRLQTVRCEMRSLSFVIQSFKSCLVIWEGWVRLMVSRNSRVTNSYDRMVPGSSELPSRFRVVLRSCRNAVR